MCVCVCICASVCVCMGMCVCVPCTPMWACAWVWLSPACAFVRVSACACVHLCTDMCACMCACARARLSLSSVRTPGPGPCPCFLLCLLRLLGAGARVAPGHLCPARGRPCRTPHPDLGHWHASAVPLGPPLVLEAPSFQTKADTTLLSSSRNAAGRFEMLCEQNSFSLFVPATPVPSRVRASEALGEPVTAPAVSAPEAAATPHPTNRGPCVGPQGDRRRSWLSVIIAVRELS